MVMYSNEMKAQQDQGVAQSPQVNVMMCSYVSKGVGLLFKSQRTTVAFKLLRIPKDQHLGNVLIKTGKHSGTWS